MIHLRSHHVITPDIPDYPPRTFCGVELNRADAVSSDPSIIKCKPCLEAYEEARKNFRFRKLTLREKIQGFGKGHYGALDYILPLALVGAVTAPIWLPFWAIWMIWDKITEKES